MNGNGAKIDAYQASAKDIVLEAAVMILVAALVFFKGMDTKFMSIAFAVILAVRFALLYKRGDVIIFIMGVIIGGGNDYLSMYKGVYEYAPPTLLPVPIPIWMLFFWGEAFLFFRRMMRFGSFMGEDAPPKPLIDIPIVVDIAIAVVYRMIIYRTAAEPWLPDALFAAILVVRLVALPPKDNERRVMLAILILGPIYEIALIAGGLYIYQTGPIFGMPLWLVIYWVFIFRFLKALIDRMEYYLPLKKLI